MNAGLAEVGVDDNGELFDLSEGDGEVGYDRGLAFSRAGAREN